MIATILALSLGFLCLLAVLAFHFPEYLTTPELRHKYSVDVLRWVLFGGLLIAGGLSLANLIIGNRRNLNVVAFLFVIAAVALGGSSVPVGNFADNTPYIGLDWFILDLLGSTLLFIVIEKMFPLYKGQPVFRAGMADRSETFRRQSFPGRPDPADGEFPAQSRVRLARRQRFPADHPPHSGPAAILLCILVADLAQYWTHRAYHEVPYLWRYHAVHHSAKTMDWLAGSRQHMFEVIFTRVCVLAPLFVLGFSEGVMNAYIIIVGFQAVFNHANVHLPWGPLKYLIVTPDFHHWHHSQDDEAIDRNYAAHYAFLDYIFGTAVKVPKDRPFPAQYGVVGDYMPDGFINQQMFPFRAKPAATPE